MSHELTIHEKLANPGLWVWVRGMVRRRVRPGDVDDTVQRIALRALRHADQYDARWTVTTWLRGMIRSECSWHPKRIGWLPEGIAQNREPRPDAVAEWHEMLDQMPWRMREAVELRLTGMTCREIGDRVGRTRQAITYRLEEAGRMLAGKVI